MLLFKLIYYYFFKRENNFQVFLVTIITYSKKLVVFKSFQTPPYKLKYVQQINFFCYKVSFLKTVYKK